jgi:hypothetical protein
MRHRDDRLFPDEEILHHVRSAAAAAGTRGIIQT